MKFGFVIDNRKCIGCHACTVACKSEHDIAIGVNRTWVKQVEKGEFPNSRRIFSVLRCNHCTDAPCVEICPVEALYVRRDGIVDFNNDRCIGCKSCMQACPYDALYIDPNTHTAAKCNYCAHRVDIGLEPACVNVCPEHAIISGDMDNPNSEISQILSREQVTVRKPEKSTIPNVYYINGDEASLTPSVTNKSDQYIWGSQSSGVGHYAKFMEKIISQKDEKALQQELSGNTLNEKQLTYGSNKKSIEVLMESSKIKRVYDTPDKGILWGWEVAGYILTKAIASGIILLLGTIWLLGYSLNNTTGIYAAIASLFFLMATGALLVKDLDQPTRFIYVLLRPQWKSWLTRGGYSITLFGGLTTLWIAAQVFNWRLVSEITYYVNLLLAIIVAIYTAFLFAQAKGRDFWQSPTIVLHMLVHSLMAGASFFAILNVFIPIETDWLAFSDNLLIASVIFNLILILIELTITHPTQDAKTVVHMILKGRYKSRFWMGTVLIGNLVPLVLLLSTGYDSIAAILVVVGIYITEQIWVEAPQRIPLT